MKLINKIISAFTSVDYSDKMFKPGQKVICSNDPISIAIIHKGIIVKFSHKEKGYLSNKLNCICDFYKCRLPGTNKMVIIPEHFITTVEDHISLQKAQLAMWEKYDCKEGTRGFPVGYKELWRNRIESNQEYLDNGLMKSLIHSRHSE